MKKRLMRCLLTLSAGLVLAAPAFAAPPTIEQVGDADSFGSRVAWIGLLSTGSVLLESDCNAPPFALGPDDRCVTVTGPVVPTTGFADLGRMTLPKGSTESLICHWISPIGFFQLENTTAEPATGSFRSRATFRFESAVLNDLSLINAQTGLPFNGAIEVPVTMYNMTRTLAPGEIQLEEIRGSRVCIAGLLNQRALTESYGLTDGLAKKVLKEPMTIRGGVIVGGSNVTRAQIGYGTRFTGDKK